MLQNPFAVRPSYTTLNGVEHVHHPIATLYDPSTTLYATFTIPFATLYDPPTTACNTFTTPLRRSTTRSQSHHNALRPFYSFVTTANSTLLQRVRHPITTLYDPSTVSLQRRTTLLQRSTTRSRSLLQFRLQRHTTLPQRSTTRSQSLLQFRYNAIQPFYDVLQPF